MDYPAKIILFGEYGILLNSKALAIPYPRLSGTFRFSDLLNGKHPKKEAALNIALVKLNNYFIKNKKSFKFLNLKHFEYDLRNGLYFDSSIPSGSGLGSSGALSAAIYDRYAEPGPQNDLHQVRLNLAAIESYFHGVSSGIDPLISWIKKPVLLDVNNCPEITIDLSPFWATYTVFLIDTHSHGNTADLVSHFRQNYRQAPFKEMIDQEYIPIINQTIDALLASDFITFETLMARYSQIQLAHFLPMIPERMIDLFRAGIESRHFYLKICGSGGGGYILGISRDPEKAESYFNLNYLEYTVVR